MAIKNINTDLKINGPLDVEGVVQSKEYLLPSSSGTAGWYKIGTLENFYQNGATAVIEIAGHQGYNATNNQDYLIKLFIKTSNGSSVGPDGQKYNSWYERTGGNASTDIQFKWDNSATHDYDLYMFVPTHSLRSWYFVRKGTGTWEDAGTSATDPGANSSSVLKATSIFNILDANVGIGTASPDEVLEVKGIIKSENTGYTNTGIIINQTSHSDAWRLMQFGGGAFSLNLNGYTGGESRFQVGTGGDVVIPTGTLTVSGTGDTSIAGSVGVGTTSPDARLNIEISAEASIPALGANTSFLKISNTGGNYGSMIGQLGSGKGYFQVQRFDGTATAYDLLLQPNGGNVGIGTTSPASGLHLQGASNTSSGFTIENTSGGTSTKFGFQPQYNDDRLDIWYNSNATAAITIKDGGNVGIGTTSPQQKLHVEGNIYLGPNNTDNFIHSGASLGLQSDSHIFIVSDVNDTSGVGGSDIVFGYGSSTNTDSNQDFTESELGTYPRVEVMRIDASTDRVGIGTTAPSEKLHVAGNITTSGISTITAAYNSSNFMQIAGNTSGGVLVGYDGGVHTTMIRSYGDSFLNGGNVGIGTASPSFNLDIYEDSSDTVPLLKLRQDGVGDASMGFNIIGSTQASIGLDNSDGDKFKISRSEALGSSTQLTIDSSGNVGIGTTSPSTKLHVDGSVTSEDLLVAKNGFKMDNVMTHSTNALAGHNSSNVSRNRYNFMDIAVNSYHWVGSSPIIIEVFQRDFQGAEYAKYILQNGYIDNGGSQNGSGENVNDFRLILKESNSWDGNSNNHRILVGDPYDTGNDQSSYDIYAIPIYLDAWYYSDYTVKVTFQSTSITRVSSFTSATQYIFRESPTATVISGAPTALPSGPNSVYGTLYGGGAVQISSSEDRISNITTYYLKPDGASNLQGNLTVGGNVGIGTTSPNTKLEIAGSDSVGVRVSGGSAGRNTILTATGLVYSTTSTGGYAMGNYVVKDSDGSTLGQISGGYGTANALTYTYYGGTAYNNAAMYILSSNKNVGIGTTSPNDKLHVDGAGQFGDHLKIGTGVTAGYYQDATNGAYRAIGTSGNRGYYFQSNAGGSTTMYVGLTGAYAGNVGIGTTSPSYKLDVAGAIRTNSRFWASTGTSNETLLMGFWDAANARIESGAALPMLITSYQGNIKLGISGGTTMTVKSTAVGIGTTTPSQKLQINGVEGLPATTGTSQNALLRLTPNAPTNGESLDFGMRVNGSDSIGWIQATNFGNLGTNYDIAINPNGGNVGIGTTSPQAKLHVESKILISQDTGDRPKLAFSENLSNDDEFVLEYNGAGGGVGNYVAFYSDVSSWTNIGDGLNFIPANGRVGIGTTSPDQKLEVASGHILVSNNYDYRGTDTGGNERTLVRINSSNEAEYGSSLAGPIKFMGGGSYTERMRIHTNGNVGIGTTNPSYKLTVNGDVDINNGALLVQQAYGINLGASGYNLYMPTTTRIAIQTAATERLSILNNGNVGIGTTSPDSLLHVNGEAQFGATSYQGNMNGGKADFSVDCGGTPEISFIGNYLQAGSTDQNWAMKLYTGVLQTYNQDLYITAGGTGTTNKLRLGTNGKTSTIVCDDGDVAVSNSFLVGGSYSNNSYNTVSSTRLLFGGGDDPSNYHIGTNLENYGGNYTKLDLRWHTGIRMGAQATYGGIRFFNNEDLSTLLFSIGKGGTNTIVESGNFLVSSGNVGIGTTSPANTLHIAASAPRIRLEDTLDTGNYSMFAADNGQLIFSADEGNNQGNSAQIFKIDNSEAMRIDSSGNVGIGTTAPDAKLASAGIVDGDFTALRLMNQKTYGSGTGTDEKVRFVMGISESGIAFSAREGFAIDVGVIDQTNSSNTIVNFGVRDGGVLGTYQTVNGHDKSVSFAGKVGIGATSPARKLHVSTGNTDVAARFENTTTNGNVIEVKTSGDNRTLNIQTDHIYSDGALHLGYDSYHTYVRGSRVGIATTSPSTTLDVDGITTSDAFRTNTSNTDYNVISRNSTSGSLYVQAAQSNSTQTILTCRYGSATVNQGTEVLAVRRNSSYFINTKLGVGTNNPAVTLDVEGPIKHKVYTVSTLPSASPAGQRAFVSDAYYDLASSHGSTFPGGGSYTIPCYSDGSNWRAG